MRKLFNRSFALLLALALCLSALSGIALPASAATVEYRYGSTSQYSDCDNVIYNWGTRGTTATFLSPNAEAFYEENDTSYATLAALSGSSTVSDIPGSPLFTTLRSLMKSNHSYVNTYDDSRDMFAFTDCQNSALTSTSISSFYSGDPIGPGWDKGSTWNREHTWPNSKGDANGSGENDIMMLRPASTSENGSRSNKAYGESNSYYHPNSESDGAYDLRGDVARIVLYVYVRWQDTEDDAAVLFGTEGVIESKDVLLKWLEEDPVDTWEMGRNDSVESITGTRNVFVDYPELGFTLFGASVPTDYTSPSGGVSSDSCSHSTTTSTTVAATCTENGSIKVSCASCGKVLSTTVLTATGHSYESGICTGCGISEPSTDSDAASGDFVLVTPEAATAGNYVIGATRGGAYPSLYFGTSSISNDWTTTTAALTVENDTIAADSLPTGTQILTLTGDNESGFSVGFDVNGTMQYLGYTSTTTSRRLALGTQYNTTLWKIVADTDGGLALSSSYGTGNYVISQNSTGTAPIRGYYTGIIYTGIYLFRQVEQETEQPEVAEVDGVSYTSLEAAVAAGGEIKLLADVTAEGFVLSSDLALDVNGHACNLQVKGAYTVTVKDSAAVCGTDNSNCVNIYSDDAITVKPAAGYVLTEDENGDGYYFDPYSIAITHISLDPSNDALGYKATLAGSSRVQAAVASYGFTMGATHTVTRENSGKIDDGVFSLRLSKIMRYKGGEKDISAIAFVTFADGTRAESSEHTTNMKQTILAVNEMTSLSETQKTLVGKYYDTHSAVMAAWLAEADANNIDTWYTEE